MRAGSKQIVLKEKEQYGDIERVMVRVPGSCGRRTGDVNTARAFIVLKDWHERDALRAGDRRVASLRQGSGKLPGVRVNTFAPGGLGARLRQARAGGASAAPTTSSSSQWSNAAAASSRSRIPGSPNVDTNYKERKPQIRVAVDRNRAADLGVSLQTVGRTLETCSARAS